MKKFIISSVFAMLMMFSVLPEAQALEFCALGSYRAGEEINAYIAPVSDSATVIAEGLPDGLWIKETPSESGKHLSLEGKSMVAGDLNFFVNVSEDPGLISCSIHFEPAAPQVSVSGDASCKVNDYLELHVSASVPDSGTLFYQWYSGLGFVALPIAGANSASYCPDTSLPGQQYYYCEVTNHNNSHTSSTESDPMLVTVAEAQLTNIDINTLPDKLIYAPGDSLDSTGLSLRLNYDNGSSTIIHSGFEASPDFFTNPGKQLVEVYYEGQRCYFEIEVKLSATSIEGIGVLTMPYKTEYELGEYIDAEGLVIRAYTKNGHLDIDSGFEISPQKLRNEGRQTITVSYEGKSCSFTVTVNDSNILKSIDIASLPTRREYSVGDTVDLSGLSLQLIYGGRTELKTSGFDWSPKELSKAGYQEITVTYEGHSTSFSINVDERAAKPSPTPTAKPANTAAPESAAPSNSPAAHDRDHQARDVNALVKIIFAVAVISLIGLAGYILYMQKRGKR